ncbi:fatty acyl-AMP ligase [Saccharophagus degradans]|uniref:AMP-dependent synthetase and ligase n=1 Tax=Saccharophagus degradans (strain 2-40 / ATCC 43961 / DSM 17024) TaxID=203122 RepID=Q21HW6_SACD2|nr:fatty acyl-AMP ligase [Saccharophagus degradans]ABD81713.1 AMP-dependent synthetase and ligase [Saccharophagus degradans 2-40]
MDKLPNEFETLVDLLQWRAQKMPNKVAFTFLKDGVDETDQITFRELDERARQIAARLQQENTPNPTALLLYPQGIEHMCALWGCMYAGVRAVPLFVPQNDRVYKRVKSIQQDSGAQYVLCDRESYDRLEKRFDRMPEVASLQWLISDELEASLANDWKLVAQERDTVAYYQYTSGSTGTPKGVMVSHGNVIYNVSDIDASWDHSEDTVLVSWLPIFHDMGLIYGFMQGVYNGFHTVLFSPNAFAQRPYTWLKAISDYRATHSGGPNSAYIMCVEKVLDEQKKDLDLSSLRVMFNGSEPVRESTLQSFTQAFAECGFKAEMHTPCYGLAEATLKVTATKLGEYPNHLTVDAKALASNKVLPLLAGEEGQVFVSSGVTVQQTEVKIVNPVSSEVCAPDSIGEIWVKGPTNAMGYYRKEEDTREIFNAYINETVDGPYMRTGDLGFFYNNELYIAGRLKDLIIVRGRNCYPQDIEEIVENCHPALSPSAGAAFSLDVDGDERLIVVQSVRRSHLKHIDAPEIFNAIRRSVSAQYGVKVHDIQLLMPASIPRTTSGKIQRRACKQAYQQKTLKVLASWQETIESPVPTSQAT